MAKYRASSSDSWKILKVKALDGMPIGSGIEYYGPTNSLPNGWLLCDGSAVSRTTYSELFEVIGTTYGTGDGSTTFNLPNLKGRVPVGQDTSDTSFDALGETGGEKIHTIQWAELASNTISTTNSGSQADGYIMRGGYSPTGTYNIGGSGSGTSLLQPYIVVNIWKRVS